ncbi:hypothetical protein JRI60_34220 [Archangium violaceum]|uniref:hypothetical protein n=1 Tax=Archangium violaceum TaxID=83451 RepID=UPI00194FE4E4|nr:hypothetical protein [Archangium violaceum]QRN94176.1 hypothetical protein JRI60_34220 [Archangium violaceum]
MSLIGLLVSLFLQCCLGTWLFMVVAFSAGGLANGRTLPAWQTRMLDLSLLAVPASSAVVALGMLALYLAGSPWLSWWWNALPVGVGLVYFLFFGSASRSRTDRHVASSAGRD